MLLDSYVQEKIQNVSLYREDMHDYQDEASEFLINNPFSALFIDLGLGKTVICLTTILDLISKLDVSIYEPVLVIAPIKVANNTWPDEIGIWEHTTALTCKHIRSKAIVDGINSAGDAARHSFVADAERYLLTEGFSKSKLQKTLSILLKEKQKEVSEAVEAARYETAKQLVFSDFQNNKACVHIINREQVEWLVEIWGKKWPYKTVFVDESDCFKDHTTKRFKAMRRVRPLIKRLHELTATPATETYLHLFAQIYLLDEGARFGRSFTRFKETYFIENKYSRKVTLKPGADKQIAKLISDITLTMKQEDYLPLNGCEFKHETITLNSDTLTIYNQMEADFIASVGGAEVEAETAAALSQKLLQIASGFLYETKFEQVAEDEFKPVKVTHHIHDTKLDELENLIESFDGENVIVAYWHKASLERLKKRFPTAVVMDKQGEAIKKWNRGEIPILLLHPQSSGHGLNIQKGGRRLVFFDIPWSYSLFLQLVGRLNRQGQKLKVFVHLLIAKGTIDEQVVEVLFGKGEMQDILFRLLKKYRKRLISNLY